MKSKVTGEEKHYQKLNKKLTKEVKEQRENYSDAITKLVDSQRELRNTKKELERAVNENNFLKTKLNLTDDEVKSLLSASKSMGLVGDTLKVMGRLYY